jgi:leader peptidase (prepilin peptidase)/N-methyltransferase
VSLAAFPAWLPALWAGLVGLVVGSFLNVVIHRLPRRVSIIRPRSRCPYCGGEIRAGDNVPVVSWLALGGRCRRCAAPISARYPLVEVLSATLFAACAATFGIGGRGLASAAFCCLLVVLAAIDLEHFLLPDRLTLPGVALGLALQSWLPETTLLDAVVGALAGAGALILLINVWFWLRDEESMGLGDVNMLAMIGAFLGWQGVATTLLFASLSGALVGLGLVAARRLTLKGKLPFGFFLALGGIVSLFAGPALARWYASWL